MNTIYLYGAIALALILSTAGVTIHFCDKIKDSELATQKSQYEAAIQKSKDEYTKELQDTLQKTQQLQQQLTDSDKKYTQELQDAQKQVSDLKSSIASGSTRMYAYGYCEDSSSKNGVSSGSTASSVDNAAPQRIQLSRETAQNLTDYAESCDEDATKLSALQDYVRQLQALNQ